MSFLKPTPATSSSSNTNNDLIKSTYGGSMADGTAATGNLSALLTGKGDTAGAQAGYNNYLQNAGYQPAMTELSRDITGQGAASGLLNSGSTAEALQSRGAELNHSFYNNYLQQLSGLSGLGLQAGGLVANAGQKSQSNGGGPSTIGTIASIAGSVAPFFSDRRLKRDIELISREKDGLGIYAFRYVMSKARVFGVMADEVAKLRPWALGPVRAGFATVIYGAL
jgi:hypothetical protein